MENLTLNIRNIKNIKECTITIPINKGIYCIVGANGSGKSTIMRALAQTVFSSSLGVFNERDFSGEPQVSLRIAEKETLWSYDAETLKWITTSKPAERIHFEGMYEGSLFYGTRFEDSLIVDRLYEDGRITSADLAEADEYVKQKLSFILHGEPGHYDKLKRIRNKGTAERLRLANTPYFQVVNKGLISQYRMSSGECLLISLLHFIYNALIRRSLPADKPIVMLIDEIELALHPVAIVRLLDLINEIMASHENLVVYLSSHSPEVIRKINPRNLFMLEYNFSAGSVAVTNPCYPSYAIRDVYLHDGYDCVVLVEDYLAKLIVQKLIGEQSLGNSRLINVLPVGGWTNVLTLQKELYDNNVLGVGTNVFSVLDGDVKEQVSKSRYAAMPKLFLPIASIEKYLYSVLVGKKNTEIKKSINDRFFVVESLDSVLTEYHSLNTQDNDGKALYDLLIKTLEKRRVTEEQFINGLVSIIMENVDFSSFQSALKNMLGR